jgi:hypothetical protein
MAGRLAHQIRRSEGRVHAHGYLPDDKLFGLVSGSHASLFPSIAEGFGLPVAESLWLGTPALCSNRGAPNEIAAGGGCLTVDCTNIAELERGIASLIADRALYDSLLAGLSARQFRKWSDYAGDVATALARHGRSQPAATGVGSRGATTAPGRGGGVIRQADAPRTSLRRFTIAAADLRCHDAFTGNGGNVLRRHDLIAYENGVGGATTEPCLFYGPYLALFPGMYVLSFRGGVRGCLKIRLAHRYGKKIGEFDIESFDTPLVFSAADYELLNFEIIGYRTPSLSFLELRSIDVEWLPLPAGFPGRLRAAGDRWRDRWSRLLSRCVPRQRDRTAKTRPQLQEHRG